MTERVGARRATGWTVVNILVVLYALIPVLWILSLSLKPTSSVKDGKLIPSQITFDNYKGIFTGNIFTSALINSIGIGLITTVIAVVIGGMAAYAVARLEFPGKKLLVGVALLIAMFPQISLVTPIFNLWRSIGLFDTWPGLIIPYITFALPLAIYTLSAFFREIPWDLAEERRERVDRQRQREGDVGNDQAGPGVEQPDAPPQVEDRCHQRDLGEHRDQKGDTHQQLLAGELQPCDGVGGHAADHHGDDRGDQADTDRVDQRRGEDVPGEDALVVVERDLRRNQLAVLDT